MNPCRPTDSLKWLIMLCAMLGTTHAWSHGTVRQVEDGNDRAIVFPDTAQYKTMVVDLHTHSVFSDGHVWPKIRVEEALRDGLDALAITEHLEYQPHRANIPHADRNTAFHEASEAAKGSDLIVIAGSEITREFPTGHVNAVFLEDANKLLQVDAPPADNADVGAYYEAANAWPAQNAIDAANEQRAFVFWNHPYWTAQQKDGLARMNDFHKRNINSDKLHGIEIANGRDYSAEAHQIALDYGLTLVGVSDVHDLIDWDYPPHGDNPAHRPVNLVLASERSADAIRDALFAGRTLVWFRDLLIAREPEMAAMLAASLEVTDAAYQGDTQVLDITISNSSDADFRLKNTTDMTFMHFADQIEIPAHGSLRLRVKPGSMVEKLDLQFEVLNALVAPRKTATITLPVEIGND